MVRYLIDLAKEIENEGIIVVVGHEKDQVIKALQGEDVSFATQEPQRGTGDAVNAAKHLWQEFDGFLIILYSDIPLLTKKTLQKALELIDNQTSKKFGGVVLTAEVKDPFAYGRIIKKDGKLAKIVEEKDTTEEQKQITEINSGIYILNSELLLNNLGKITAENAQREFLFTDIIEHANKDGWEILPLKINDPNEIVGINTMEQLLEAEKILEERIKK